MFNFLIGVFGNFRDVGSFLPSSRFLAKNIAENLAGAKYVAELGSGVGNVTDHLIKNMPSDGVLICVEINKRYFRNLKKRFKDKRVKIILGNAENIDRYIKRYDLNKLDAVVSGLPISIMPSYKRSRVLNECCRVLKNNGRFIQFQYNWTSLRKLRFYFRKKKIRFVAINLPPALIFVGEKWN